MMTTAKQLARLNDDGKLDRIMADQRRERVLLDAQETNDLLRETLRATDDLLTLQRRLLERVGGGA